jgi:hypothetical protein
MRPVKRYSRPNAAVISGREAHALRRHHSFRKQKTAIAPWALRFMTAFI